MLDPVDNMRSSSPPPPDSTHPSSEMYYTNVLFGHPLFAPSVLLRRNSENGSQAPPPTTHNELTSSLNDDFIELDVASGSITNLSDHGTDDHNSINSLHVSSPNLVNRPSSESSHISPSSSGLILEQPPIFMADVLPNQSDNHSNIPQIKPESPGVDQPSSSSEQFLPSSTGVDESSIPQSSSIYSLPSSSDAFLMSEHEIAQGNSITSTVRGCDLLDSHSLEDLCNYLPILCHKYPPLTSDLPPHSTPSSTSHARRQQIQKKSSSLPSRLTASSDDESASIGDEAPPRCIQSIHGGRMVDYLLTCSRLGSTSISDFHNIVGEGDKDPRKRVRLPLDWRRGRSDGLVSIVGASRSLASRVTGRFVTDVFEENGDAEHLGHWLSSWIQSGAVIFFAQLDTPDCRSGGKMTGCHNQTNSCCELIWRHRLVYGVTNNTFVHLSNPIEKLHVRSLMAAFNTKTTICVPKSDLLNLWRSDEMLKQGYLNGTPTRSDQDLSLLAVHSDPRWCQFNILGKRSTDKLLERQVIATLRECDWGMERQSLGQNSMEPSTSNGLQETIYQENLRCEPHLVIPCDQRPGFSLFLPRSASLDKPLEGRLTP
ncbi:unnamed protein product [Rodentolepis nana]|uniref:Mediator of RNA polymerase II transcription subunit 13 n=1 Tax=Rodentolepis nana TaxID=102285 RepID=A0A0R3TLJ0_RODNA|nr:unnamed protein product [Rodentolepis nana]